MLEIEKKLEKLNIDKKTPLILSVSGGVDSMVLLDLLVKSNFNVIVIHFNHNTRKTNILDENLIISYANNYNVTYHIESINIKSGNFHEEARNIRYNLLYSYAKKYDSKYILTAHHLDDLFETSLLKIVRGSNLNGYAGIKEISNYKDLVIFRPLLSKEKKELIAYANLNNIPYNTDESNLSNKYTRNRIRHSVIPILKQENGNLKNKILNFNKQLSSAYLYIRKQAKAFLNNSLVINCPSFNDIDIAVKREVIAVLFEKNKIIFKFETIENIIGLIDTKSNFRLDLEGNYSFIKSYDIAYIEQKKEKKDFKIILDQKENFLPNNISITFLENKSNISSDNIKICYNKLTLPLIARTRNNGDVLSFKYGHKKLKKFLIDKKIPIEERNELWLITDSNNTILYIPNLYQNDTLGNLNAVNLKIGDSNGKNN